MTLVGIKSSEVEAGFVISLASLMLYICVAGYLRHYEEVVT